MKNLSEINPAILVLVVGGILLAIYLTGNRNIQKNTKLILPEVLNESVVIPQKLCPKQLSDRDLLLPDLVGEKLSDVFIEFERGEKVLHFDTTVSNIGDGPLEMWGSYNPNTDSIMASQRIYKKDGTYIETLTGNFIYHEEHAHWHFEEFTEFELYTYRSDGIPDKKLTSTGKMTFCLFDRNFLYDSSLPGVTDTAGYPNCDPVIQGISVGWSDTYGAKTPGQDLELGNIPDGRYAVRSVTDPRNRIVEKNEDNNITVSYIEINGDNVSILSGP